MSLDRVLEAVTSWARTQPGLAGVVLVGSQARGTASASSDIDIVLLADDPEIYLRDTTWSGAFGDSIRHEIEDWGRVTSVRVFYDDGREVEFGVTDTRWGSDPNDDGTVKVIRGGARVVYDRGLHLASRLETVSGIRQADVRAAGPDEE